MTSFVISDTHFGHTNCWAKFKLPNGEPMRPFTSTEEMDETMVNNWNSVVNPKDTVYHLGDVAISRKNLDTVKRLNGKLRLIRGNHDIFKDQDYYDAGFEKIVGTRVFVDKWIMSHIPLHPDSVSDRFRVNIHGHTHNNRVTTLVDKRIDSLNDTWCDPYEVNIDPLYHCVSVEHINYTPVSFEDLETRLQEEWDAIGYEPKQGYFNGGNG